MNMRTPKPTPRGRPSGPVLPDVLTRCLLLRSGRLNHPPGLGSTARSPNGERSDKGRGEHRPTLPDSGLVQLASDRAARKGCRMVVDVVGGRVGTEGGPGRTRVRGCDATLL